MASVKGSGIRFSIKYVLLSTYNRRFELKVTEIIKTVLKFWSEFPYFGKLYVSFKVVTELTQKSVRINGFKLYIRNTNRASTPLHICC